MKSVRKIYMLLFLSLSFACALLYARVPAKPVGDAHKLRPESLSYYTAYDENLSIDIIFDHYKKGQFLPLQSEILNEGIPRNFYWVHFGIANEEEAAGALVIDIENSRLNELELFEASGNSIRSLGKLGDFYPFFQRAILHKNFIYEINIPPGRKNDYFLFVNQVGHTFTLPLKIYSAKSFGSITFNDYLLDGVTYGALLFVAVVSFLFFLTSRHYLYLYYGLYIITGIAWFLSYFGLGYQYIWGKYPGVNTAMPLVTASMNILLNLRICQILLRLPKTNRSLNTLINLIKWVLVIAALIPLFINLNVYGYNINHTYLIYFLSAILLAMAAVSFSVILFAIRGLIAAKLYLLASLLKAGSIINLAFLELGLTPAIYNMEGLLQIGIFIEITLLTYAIAQRYTDFKARTFIKVIEAHENERSIISKEIHDGISNSLTGINYGLRNFTKGIDQIPAEKIRQLEKLFFELDKVQVEARNISHNTMPDYIKKSSITEIVGKHIGEVQKKIKDSAEEKSFIQLNFSANEQTNKFSDAVKLNIFRITQEILVNILKHSKAKNADILFSFGKKEMMIIAEDNGTGFRETNEKNNGSGIKNIKTRVELLNGSFIIRSPAYKTLPARNASTVSFSGISEYGTMIKIRIPYRNNLLNKTRHDF